MLLRVPDDEAQATLDSIRDNDPYTRFGLAQYEVWPGTPSSARRTWTACNHPKERDATAAVEQWQCRSKAALKGTALAVPLRRTNEDGLRPEGASFLSV